MHLRHFYHQQKVQSKYVTGGCKGARRSEIDKGICQINEIRVKDRFDQL